MRIVDSDSKLSKTARGDLLNKQMYIKGARHKVLLFFRSIHSSFTHTENPSTNLKGRCQVNFSRESKLQ